MSSSGVGCTVVTNELKDSAKIFHNNSASLKMISAVTHSLVVGHQQKHRLFE